MQRVLEHVFGVAGFHDAAQVHHRHAAGDVAYHRQVVGHEQVGHAQLVLQVLKQVDHAGLDGHVQCEDRLVEQHELRVDRQRTRDGDALALAAGELRGETVHLVGVQFHQTHEFANAFANLLLGVVLDLHRLGQDVVDRQTRVERAHRVLEDVLHGRTQLAALLARHLVFELGAEHLNLAVLRLLERHDLHERGGLAGAGLAHDAEGLAGVQVEVHAAHRVHGAGFGGEADGEVAY